MLAARPEDEILVCVARRSLDAAMAERLRELLKRDLDWKLVLASAQNHCLTPLLYFHLNAVGQSLVPRNVMSRLEGANYRNTQSSLFFTAQLVLVLEFLEENGIRAIPFKGPTLALRAYGDVGLRQFGDLDILVHRKDILKVKELLMSRGFKSTLALTNAQQAALLRFDCAYNFDNEQGVMLDVHWDLVERHFSFDIDVDGLWYRLEPVTISGKRLRTVSAEDLLLILCLHGFTHLWERLGWICDLASLIESRNDLDWQLVLQTANRRDMRRILLLGLLLAVDLLDARIPAEIRQAADAEAVVKKLAAQIREQLFLERSAPPGLFRGAILNLKMRERKRDMFGSSLRLLLTPRSYDWMFLPLPEWLFFLYYPLRPLRLAGKYGAKLLKNSWSRRNSIESP